MTRAAFTTPITWCGPFRAPRQMLRDQAYGARLDRDRPRVAVLERVRMIRGPLFVGEDYALEREVVALSDGRRTESYWVSTTVREERTGEPVATTLLNHAVLRASYPGTVEVEPKSAAAAPVAR